MAQNKLPVATFPAKNAEPQSTEPFVDTQRRITPNWRRWTEFVDTALRRMIKLFTFLALEDTPDSYSGQTLKGVRVKADESGLEFFTIPSTIGDVTGPASAVDGDFATFNGTTGKIIKDSGWSRDIDGTLAANSDSKIATQKATKTYVDAKVAGLSWKQAVRAATTANGTLATAFANGQVIDGVTLVTGDRILLKNQTTAADNGIYIVAASGAPARATDADAGSELINATCYISEGTSLADTEWTCTTNAPISIGVTSLSFSQSAPTPPGGSNGQVQYNNSGAFGGYTNAQLTALINTFSSSLSGAVSASGGGTANFLRADGAWAAPPGAAGTTTVTAPQGRLSLVTGVPVMTSDQTAKTHVYYTPFAGYLVPIYNGSTFSMAAVSPDLDMALDTTNQVSGSLYDLFAWSNSGTLSIGAGPAWSSSTARGTGAGTTELQMLNGIWTNKNSITLKNGAGAGTAVSANQATYLGTIYCTANGQTGMAFKPTAASGGTNNILGLWNAYNRVPVIGVNRDNGASWVKTSTTWEALHTNNNNRISYVDGLAQSSADATLSVLFFTSGSGAAAIGVSLDSTSATPAAGVQGQTAGAANTSMSITSREGFSPSLGFHFLQAMQVNNVASNNVTFVGATGGLQTEFLTVSLEM